MPKHGSISVWDYVLKYFANCILAEAHKTFDEYRVAMSNSPDEIANRHTIAGIKERDYVPSPITSHTEPRSFPRETSTVYGMDRILIKIQ